MRTIHASDDTGTYEAVMFVEDSETDDAMSFFEGTLATQIDFDETVEFPCEFSPATYDVYEKRR